MIPFLNALYRVLRLTLSNKPEDVAMRKDIEDGVKQTYVDPFMSGYKGTPMPPQPEDRDVNIFTRLLVVIAVGLAVLIGILLLLINRGGS